MAHRRIFVCLTLSALVLAGFGCATQAPPSSTSTTVPAAPATSQATIMVPQDEAAYTQAVDQSGGDPKSVAGFAFVAKPITYPAGTDEERAVAQAAASELQVGPTGADSIVYFKVAKGTAYVLMQMDVDGWAGVSMAIAKVHPLIEKSLKQFPDITSVAFTVAPGDNIQDVINSVNEQEDNANTASGNTD